ncbi:uncharacterized protein [Anas platyrhynchos]|uniref:uncharacterized protein isoform X1 n=1 Tax=Anas platyrhynchos TaxID=8839 RepID=UPI003AF2D1C7
MPVKRRTWEMEEQGELDTGLLKLCWYLGRVSGASGVGVWSKAMLPSSVLQLWEQRRALQVCSEARWKATADNSPSSPTNEPPPVLHVVGNVLLIRHWRIHSQTTSWGNFLETQEKPKEETFFDPKEPGEPYLFPTLGWKAGRAEDKVCIPQREVTIRKSYILPLLYCLKRTFIQRSKMEENQHLFRTFWLLSPDLCWQGSGSVSGSTTSEKRLLSQHLSCGTARLVCRQIWPTNARCDACSWNEEQ